MIRVIYFGGLWIRSVPEKKRCLFYKVKYSINTWIANQMKKKPYAYVRGCLYFFCGCEHALFLRNQKKTNFLFTKIWKHQNSSEWFVAFVNEKIKINKFSEIIMYIISTTMCVWIDLLVCLCCCWCSKTALCYYNTFIIGRYIQSKLSIAVAMVS